jgi:3-oxoacyl-[acyl-carrier protein] reductase
MDLGIKRRTALITAASRGIGRSCALTLAREGANIVICARGEDELQKTAAFIRTETGVTVVAAAADVTRSADIDRIIKLGKTEASRIDILIAIGGSPPRGTFIEVGEEQFRAAFEMTVMALVRLITGVLPEMRRNKWGRIVTVQSRSVREPIPDLTLSNATRPGAAGLIKHLSNEVAADNVLMNTVLPGRIMTDRLRGAAERSGQSGNEFFKTQAPICRSAVSEKPGNRRYCRVSGI